MNFQYLTLLYLDPNFGSVLVQLVIAGVVGAGFLIKIYWKKIKTFFNRSKPETNDASDIQLETQDDSHIHQ